MFKYFVLSFCLTLFIYNSSFANDDKLLARTEKDKALELTQKEIAEMETLLLHCTRLEPVEVSLNLKERMKRDLIKHWNENHPDTPLHNEEDLIGTVVSELQKIA